MLAANGSLPAIFISQTLRTFLEIVFKRVENWQCIGAMVDLKEGNRQLFLKYFGSLANFFCFTAIKSQHRLVKRKQVWSFARSFLL